MGTIRGKRSILEPAPPAHAGDGRVICLKLSTNERTFNPIAQSYDAARDLTLWPDIVPKIADCCLSTGITVWIQDPNTGRVEEYASSGSQPDPSQTPYESADASAAIAATPTAALRAQSMLARAGRSPSPLLERTELNPDESPRFDVRYVIHTGFSRSQETLATIGLSRRRAGGPYGEGDMTRVAQVRAHVRSSPRPRSTSRSHTEGT